MDRQIVYPGSLPQDTDVLYAFLDMMVAVGNVLAAAFGTGTYVDGLACTPSGLTVNIAAGRIIALSTVDTNAYGSLGVNAAALMKMGINLTTQNYNLAAYVPGTSGWSVNVLIEAQLLETDTTPIVLPYFNSSNPLAPYSGPANSGASQNTQRVQRVSIQIKSGTGAPSGTQPTPSVDAGWAALYVVTLTQGVGTISAGNILTAPSAPFIGTKLGQLRTKLMGNLNLYVQTPANGGNDSTNNGLGINVAFATIQAAWNALINNYDLNGYSVTINVGAGTFAAVNCSTQPTGYGASSSVTISGVGASTVVGSAIVASFTMISGAVVNLLNMTLSGGYGVVAGAGGVASIGAGVIFGTCTSTHIFSNAGQINFTSGYTITGGAAVHWGTALGGVVVNQAGSAPTITLTGTPSFSTAFAQALSGQITIWNGAGVASFSGSASSGTVKFTVSRGGVVDTNTANASYLPGGTAGTTGSGTNTGFYA